MTILHLISSHNPVFDTLSSYAFTDRGGMFEASVLSLSIGSLVLLGALYAARVNQPHHGQRFFPPGHSASRPPRSFPPVTPHTRIR
jgi:hypothetical protein